MKAASASYLAVLGTALCWPPATMLGQEALRGAIDTERALATRRQSWAAPVTGLHAGPVQLNLGASFSGEWNDNVNLDDQDPAADYVLRPQADAQLFWPATQHARLLLGFGIGYAYYVGGEREDRLILSPDSLFAVEFPVGDALYSVYDQVSYSDDLVTEGGLAGGVPDYARIDNTAGVRGAWRAGDWSFQSGYSYFNYFSLTDTYAYLNRGSHQLFGQAAYVFAGGARLGIEASGSRTDYDEPFRSDFYSASFGPFVAFEAWPGFSVDARGGYVIYNFDDDDPALGPGDVDSFYAGLRVNHELTERIRHNLSGVREIGVGVNSEYTERFLADYRLTWAIRDALQLSGSVFYEHGREPEVNVTEIYDRWGLNVGAQYTVRPRLTLGVAYRYTYRDSNLPDRDYTQNTVNLSVGYRW